MAAWIEDAQILTHIKDLNKNRDSILQRTADVDDFLSDEKLSSTALVAPKGFGKTLMLKLKRVSLQEYDYKCLPQGIIVDRPKDRPPILPLDTLDMMEKSENWETLWQIAIAISITKSYKDDADVKIYISGIQRSNASENRLTSILDNSLIDTPFEILHAILMLSRSDLFDALKYASTYTSIFSKIHKNTAIFIDNIDEYLEHYINYEYLRKHEFYRRYLRVWHNGQIGAWLAIRRLNGINPHVKIFVSIRKEAFHYAAEKEPLFANLRGFSRELRYSVEDIRQIIENNILIEPLSKLVDKNSKDPITMFVGTEYGVISNSGTGKQELLLDYWLRHCTLRPRDAVMIGKEISKIKPERRNKVSIRTAINYAAAERVHALFAETLPFFEGLIPDLIPRLLMSNVLTSHELAQIADAYYKVVSEEFGITSESAHHPFCALYSIGLLGVVAENRDIPGQLIQKFSPVGHVPFGSFKVLPQADKYVIHPSLTDYIQGKNVGFLRHTNRQNVIGDGLEWRTEQDIRFVAIGDMRGYRNAIMNNVGASQTFNSFWEETFSVYTGKLDYAVTSGGDSILAADRSAVRLIRALRNIMIALKQSNYGLSFRFGLHSGFWRLNQDAEGVAHPEIADVIGVAARLEPHAHAGHLLLSENFISKASEAGVDMIGEGITAPENDYFGDGVYDPQDGLLISKAGKEKDERVRVQVIKVTL